MDRSPQFFRSPGNPFRSWGGFPSSAEVSGFNRPDCAKCKSGLFLQALTLAELEATTCTRLTRLLSLDLAGIAGKETGGLQGSAVGLFVNLAKSAGDSETDGLCLTLGTSTDETNLDVKLTCCAGDLEGLVHDVLEGFLLEVIVQLAAVDNDVTGSGDNINTSDS